jgi:hypothetical protein
VIHERPTRRERREAGEARFLAREQRRGFNLSVRSSERMMMFAACASVVAVLAIVFVVAYCVRH